MSLSRNQTEPATQSPTIIIENETTTLLPPFTYQESITVPTYKFLKKINLPPLIKLAIYHGQLDKIADYFLKYKNEFDQHIDAILCEAAYCGHVSLLKYFFSHNYLQNNELLNIAIMAGHLDLAKWLRKEMDMPFMMNKYVSHQQRSFTYYLEWVIHLGHIQIANWLIQNKWFSFDELIKHKNLITSAIKNNQLTVLKWLVNTKGCSLDPRYPLSDMPLLLACQYGSLEMLTWLIEIKKVSLVYNNTNLEYNPFFLALLGGQFENLNYLLTYQHQIQPNWKNPNKGNEIQYQVFLDEVHTENDFEKLLHELEKLKKAITHPLAKLFFQILNHLQSRFLKSNHIFSNQFENYVLTQAPLGNLQNYPHLLLNICQFLSLKNIYGNVPLVNTTFHSFVNSDSLNRYKCIQYGAKGSLTTKIDPSSNDFYPRKMMMTYSTRQFNIIDACLSNDLERFRQLKVTFFDLNFKYGELHLYSSPEYHSFVSFMLANYKNNLCLNYFVKHSVNCATTENFFIAAYIGRLDLVKLFLNENEELISHTNVRHQTAFLLAAINGQVHVLNFLMEKNTDVEVKTHDLRDPGIHRMTPLDFALSYHHPEAYKLLLKVYDAYPQFKHKFEMPMIHAVKRGWADIVKILLEHDSKYSQEKDLRGRTPFLWAAQLGDVEILKILLTHNRKLALVMVKSSNINNNNTSPLDYAVQNDRIEAIQLLLSILPVEELTKKYAIYCHLPSFIINTINSAVLTSAHSTFISVQSLMLLLNSELKSIMINNGNSHVVIITKMLECLVNIHNDLIDKSIKSCATILQTVIKAVLSQLFHSLDNILITESNNWLTLNLSEIKINFLKSVEQTARNLNVHKTLLKLT